MAVLKLLALQATSARSIYNAQLLCDVDGKLI